MSDKLYDWPPRNLGNELMNEISKKMVDDIDKEIFKNIVGTLVPNNQIQAIKPNLPTTTSWNINMEDWEYDLDPFERSAAYEEIVPRLLAFCAIVKERYGITLKSEEKDPDFKIKEEKAKSYLKYIREDDKKKDVAAIVILEEFFGLSKYVREKIK